ncbi:MAG: hypothetical protein LUG16_06720 [Candidatus Gastranaerophilales bacterium]|nr:hypothetical protein [Candidatus Gastranaerophilales bacterium]
MSVSVSAVPFLLIAEAIGGLINISDAIKDGLSDKNKTYHLDNDKIEEVVNNKTFPTRIVDEATLIKTLKEHGATQIYHTGNIISCNCEAFHFKFQKPDNEKPYELTISFKEESGLNECIENISSEYESNAQEISYNKIVERLEEQNLSIENEEIYDDNTIVLTVNLE